MRKIVVLFLVAVFLVISLGIMVIAQNDPHALGPAPDYHDGISDGSGLDPDPFGKAPAPGSGYGTGPAPSSGDGDSDGPEWN